MREITVQFLQFTTVGVIGTGAHFATLIMLVQGLDIDPVSSSAVGFVVGANVNYGLNYYFTFRSQKRHREAIIKFFIIAVIGLCFNTLIMTFAIRILILHYLLAQVIATGLVLFWSYTGSRLWVFRETKSES